VLRNLLAAYADNLTTAEAIQRVFGVSEAEFEQRYVEYLKRLVAGMPGLKRPATERFADLLQRQRHKPEDADLAARVAYGYLRRGANEEARHLAERALKRHPKHPLASYVVARLWVLAEQPQQAIDLLGACLDRKDPEPRALNLLAGLKLKAGEFAEAAELYRLGRQHDPYNVGWDRALARVYLRSADNEKLAEVLARLAQADPDDLASRKKLAQIALEGEDFEAAAHWANQALRIDVTDSGIHRLFAEALVGRHNYAKAIEHYEAAIQLDPEALDQRFALAEAYLKAGKSREARRVLEELLRLDPDHLEAGTEELEEKEQM
jgi:tetratricopeptide (TPR) repeat protein